MSYPAAMPRFTPSHRARIPAMSAFAEEHGGSLTAKQVSILADQIEVRWMGQQVSAAGLTLPTYSAQDVPDADRGEAVFQIYCARCHTAVDPSYLALVSDQALRTTVIVGRTDLGTPDWRSYVAGRAMKPQEISDLVAWLSAQRGVTP